MSIKKQLLHLSLGFVCLTACHYRSQVETTESTGDFIQRESISDAGIDSVMIDKIDTAVRNGTYTNIHSLLIAHNNKLVYEKYWPGNDENWGDNLGMIQHGVDSLHDIRSISKSIVSACIGIAIEQGKIKSVNQKIFEFFPEFAKLDTGLKSSLTIKHLLTMSSGIKWNETISYSNPENSEIRMIRSPNPIMYALSQPMDHLPGEVWNYNGGSTQLLAAIIEKATGKKIDQFTKEFLFDPLGIKHFEWAKIPGANLPAAASGLRLRSRDLLKFGLCYANQGNWNGRQIVPMNWIEESWQPQMQRSGGDAYGYQFWLWKANVGNKPTFIVSCEGNGGQSISFYRSRNVVIVITAGNYNRSDMSNGSDALIIDYLYPSLKE